MNVVIISYGIIEYDGRLKELCRVFDNLGNVKLWCCSLFDTSKHKIRQEDYLSKKYYLGFIWYVLKQARAQRDTDILVCDNLFAAFPTLLVRRWINPKAVVQDVRELYLYRDVHGSSKLFSFFERKLMREANVVLCANQERAELMFKEYKLKDRPLVFENIRFLEGNYNLAEMEEKYKNTFTYKYNIISTSGLFMERDTDKLITAMKYLSDDFGLFFVGNATAMDVEKFNELCRTQNIRNAFLIGKVPMNELKFIVQQCQIGAVHYHKKDMNNLYCASGKIYEFLHEGLPIVTTENPPLKSFCKKTNTGIADDLFYNGILTIANNYAEYKSNIQKYIQNVSPEAYCLQTAELIKEHLGKTKY